MILRVFIFIILSSALYSQENIQYNIVLDEDGVVYETKYLNDKLRAYRIDHTQNQDSFLISMCTDLSSQDFEKRQILVYLHGMWGSQFVNFRKAYNLMHKQIIDDSSSDIARIISIKWPANDFNYKKNKKRIPEIAVDVSTIIHDFVRKFQFYNYLFTKQNAGVDLLVHSLGTELLKESIKLLPDEQWQYPLFDQIIWAAADLDHDVFKNDPVMNNIDKLAKRNHVYYSNRDITLDVSKSLNKSDRLGRVGPFKDQLYPKKTYFVNVSYIKDDNNIGDLITGHSYFRSSPLVINDMVQVLKEYQIDEISNRRNDGESNVFVLEQVLDQ